MYAQQTVRNPTQTSSRTNTRKKTDSWFVRLVLSWVMVALIFSAAGASIALAVNRTTHKNKVDLEAVTYFGQYSGEIMTQEIPLDWTTGNVDLDAFIPLTNKLDLDLQEFIYCLCAGYEIDYTLVMAIIQQESSFKADAISASNDYGLMQINSRNFNWLSGVLGIDDYLDPYQNVRAGVFVLRKLFEKYQDTSMVLMAYNMGETGAARLWKQNIYNTKYSDSVLEKQATLVAGGSK